AALVQSSGDGQNGPILTTLRDPFVVTVLDASGTPVVGVSVIWSVIGRPQGATGQVLSPVTTTSNDSGKAITFLTLGNLPGTYTVTATAAGLSGSPVTFTAIASLGSGTPATLVLTSGDNQTGTVGTQLSMPFVVTVLDSASRPLDRVNVTFAIESSSLPSGAIGQTLSAMNVPTDNAGRAAAVLTLGNKVGTYRVLASVPGVANSPLIFTATAQEVPGAALVYLSGSNQAARVRTTLPNPFVTVVFDEQGNPVSGAAVTFSIDSLPAGSVGYSLSATVDTTDELGVASSSLTFGQRSGRYVVSASSPGLANSPLRFVATALPGVPASILAVSGNNQSKSILQTLDSALLVRVVDADNNPVPGIPVSFLISSTPGASVGHSLSVSEADTKSNGEASTVLTLGDQLGIYKVTASVANVGAVEFSATTEVVLADVNNDDEVNIADLTTIIDHILGRITLSGIDSIKADLNGDGVIDILDVVKLQRFLLGIESSLNKSSARDQSYKFGGSAIPTTALVRGEFEATKFGIRFNMENAVPVMGIQLVIRFKNVVPAAVGILDLIFPRARIMELPVNTSGRELRILALNDNNIPIEPGKGTFFRFTRELSNLNDIEEVELIVSTGQGFHQAL
ncbi:MAG: dockerin type I domain-containing protein, partial [Bacteroidota bacterium]